MKNFLLLSWFYSGNYFNELIFQMLETGFATVALKELYRKHKNEILEICKSLDHKGISIVTYKDFIYPKSLKNLEKPPWVICCYGDLKALNAPEIISVVGSRRPDPEAVYWLHDNLKSLNKSTVVLSGGAIGIDQHVHHSADLAGLSGICVLPVGIFETYPQSLKKPLKAYIGKKNFLVISQFHPFKKVSKSSFYPRNYLIAALSNKVLVVQAGQKSGTMVTAQYAVDLGKAVYTIPGSPWDDRYSGNLKLLEEGAYQMIDLNLIHI